MLPGVLITWLQYLEKGQYLKCCSGSQIKGTPQNKRKATDKELSSCVYTCTHLPLCKGATTVSLHVDLQASWAAEVQLV